MKTIRDIATKATLMTTPPQYGPPLGNVPAPDSYLRTKQNIDGLAKAVNDVKTALPGPNLTTQQIEQVQAELSATGTNPLNLTNLPGSPAGSVTSLNGINGQVTLVNGTGIGLTILATPKQITIALAHFGPGAGTYTTGAKLTPTGTNGTITLDNTGRVSAISPAT